MIRNSTNIPDDIKTIVKVICRGYIREGNDKIPLTGINNVLHTNFIIIYEDNYDFTGENKILGEMNTHYESNCKYNENGNLLAEGIYGCRISMFFYNLYVIKYFSPKNLEKN